MSRYQSISFKQRFRILARDNFTCQYCGAKVPDTELEVDHIVPVSKGGKSVDTNLITACHACNIGKGDKSYEFGVRTPIGKYMVESYNLPVTAYEWATNIPVSVAFKAHSKKKADTSADIKDDIIQVLAANNSKLQDELSEYFAEDKRRIIELLEANKAYYINLWGGNYYAMPNDDQARCDELDKCILEIKALSKNGI